MENREARKHAIADCLRKRLDERIYTKELIIKEHIQKNIYKEANR